MLSGPSDGGAAVAGIDLARAMPRSLGANIREALDRLEQENKVKQVVVEGATMTWGGATIP